MIFLFIATIDNSHLSQDRSRKENLFILLQMNFYFLLTLGAVKKGFFSTLENSRQKKQSLT